MSASVVQVTVEGIDVGALVIEELFGHGDDFEVIITGIALEVPGIQVEYGVITMIFNTGLRTIKNDLAEAQQSGVTSKTEPMWSSVAQMELIDFQFNTNYLCLSKSCCNNSIFSFSACRSRSYNFLFSVISSAHLSSGLKVG